MSGNPATSSAPAYKITGPMEEGYDEILTPEAMTFVAELAQRFGPRVENLLAERKKRQQEIDDGVVVETCSICHGEGHPFDISQVHNPSDE